ncbi:hypothetical protein ES705_51083 [subsurface metagenome]
MGFIPSSSAFSRDIMTSIAAPSFIPEEFPAVTVPSFLNAGFKRESFSIVVPARGYSSLSITTDSSFFTGMETGIISSVNFPALIAFSACC